MSIRGCTIVLGIWVIGVGLAVAQQSTPPKPTSGEKKNIPASPTVVAPKTPGTSAAAIPQEAELMVLLRSTLLAVNQAGLTGNYTVLRDLGSPGFRSKNSAEHLMANFQSIRNIDMGSVAVLPANLVRQPAIDANGRLRLTGFFPSKPGQVNFDLAFEVVDSRWRLSAMALNIQQTPVAATGSLTQPNTTQAPVTEPKATKAPTAAKPPTPEKTSAKPAPASNPSPDATDVDKPKEPPAAATKPPTSEKKSSAKPASAASASPDVRDNVDRLETGSAPEPEPKPKPKPKPKGGQNPFSAY
jgi:hypothetical protein